jgi:ABC-type transport system involved in multi-copper enzyme maturation permease subunit
VTPHGLLGSLYRGSLIFNSATWTYLGNVQRTTSPINILLLIRPWPVAAAGLILGAYTLLGLGLSLLVVYRREPAVVVVGRAGHARRSRQADGAAPARSQPARLPAWGGRGPLVVRLAYAYLVAIAHTSLVQVGAAVVLLFALAWWAIGAASNDNGALFRQMPGYAAPLALSTCLLMAGLLAPVIGILAVSNEHSFGTRRATLARGITRLQALVGQSLALIATVGALQAGLLIAVLIPTVLLGRVLPLGGALVVLAVGLISSGMYVGAVQIGAALTRSSLSPMLGGLGILVVDWAAIIAPTISRWPAIANIARYSPTLLAFGLVARGALIEQPGAPAPLSPLPSVALLLAGALLSHALALVITYRHDA